MSVLSLNSGATSRSRFARPALFHSFAAVRESVSCDKPSTHLQRTDVQSGLVNLMQEFLFYCFEDQGASALDLPSQDVFTKQGGVHAAATRPCDEETFLLQPLQHLQSDTNQITATQEWGITRRFRRDLCLAGVRSAEERWDLFSIWWRFHPGARCTSRVEPVKCIKNHSFSPSCIPVTLSHLYQTLPAINTYALQHIITSPMHEGI